MSVMGNQSSIHSSRWYMSIYWDSVPYFIKFYD